VAAALIWSSEALDDIDTIGEFIQRNSPSHAQRVVEALLDLGQAIAANPLAGRIVPELDDSKVRERFLYSYRVIYEVGESQIAVLAVLHGRRLLESVGERFGG